MRGRRLLDGWSAGAAAADAPAGMAGCAVSVESSAHAVPAAAMGIVAPASKALAAMATRRPGVVARRRDLLLIWNSLLLRCFRWSGRDADPHRCLHTDSAPVHMKLILLFQIL